VSRAPSPAELLAARAFVGQHHPRTPLRALDALSRASGCDVYAKCESEAPVRSFKARGPLWSLSRLGPDERERGVVTASTGNHGQGVAVAGTLLGIRTVVVVPLDTPQLKADRIRGFGAELHVVGDDLDAAAAEAHALAEREGLRYLEDGEDPGLMAGAGSIAWEILEELPGTDAIVVPVGGGNLIAGIGLVAKRLNPAVRVIGVQSDAAPAAVRSWQQRRIVHAPCTTRAGGLATTYPGALALEVMCDHVDEMLLVPEQELGRHVVAVLAATGAAIELAAAAAYAGFERLAPGLAGRHVVLVQSGGNIPTAELRGLLDAYPS
jgi:threonine dehydratase